jgi:hypothetical protein
MDFTTRGKRVLFPRVGQSSLSFGSHEYLYFFLPTFGFNVVFVLGFGTSSHDGFGYSAHCRDLGIGTSLNCVLYFDFSFTITLSFPFAQCDPGETEEDAPLIACARLSPDTYHCSLQSNCSGT